MGRIKTKVVKRYAKLLLERFPEKFTDDFEYNKEMLRTVTEIKSLKLRNQLAGYITSLAAKKRGKEEEEEKTEKIEAVTTATVLEAPLATVKS